MLNWLTWILTFLLYSPVLVQLFRSRWEAIDYTHAYFILPISLWLVWRKRKELTTIFQKHITAKISDSAQLGAILFLNLIILGSLMFIFGWRQDYLSVSTLSLIPLLFGISGFLYGANMAKTLLFPILYLLLMVPPPLGILDGITIPMRHGISVVTELVLKLFHYPITRDGLLLSLGGHEIYMGAPCSGFRSLITMISLGLVYAYINKGTFKAKTILICSIIPLALLGNFIRVMGICLTTFYLGEAAGHKFHDISGFVIFIVLIFGMIGIDSLLQKHTKP